MPNETPSSPDAVTPTPAANEPDPAPAAPLPDAQPPAAPDPQRRQGRQGARRGDKRGAPVDTTACAAELKARFPALFDGPPKPLKLRIQADIQERAPGVFTRAALSAFLHRHTTGTGYLIALTQQGKRLDLDGQPAGEVAAEHREAAAQEVERRRARRQEREAQMRQAGAGPRTAAREARPARAPERRPTTTPASADEAARRERAQLLRAFESSPLAKSNFCALKGITPQALDAQLALARAEAAARMATHPPAEAQARPDHPDRPDRPDRPRSQGQAAAQPPAKVRGPEPRQDSRPIRRHPHAEAAPPAAVVQAQGLRRLVRTLVERSGSSPTEAERVAHHLVDADLSGHDTQGVAMLPRYLENLRTGGLVANREIVVVNDHGALVTLDGQAGYGQVIGAQAMVLGIERARVHGVAVLGLTNSHHLGRIGAYAEQCLDAGLVSIHFVNVVTQPLVAPFGGSDARLATNPMCVGIPMGAGDAPLLLDFATSRLAMGKLRHAQRQGRPSRDPAVMLQEPRGALLPFGAHKGYGLAVACELLAGALTGGLTLHEKPGGGAILNNMLSILVDPERLGSAAHLAAQARAFAAWVKASPPSRESGVMLPGEPEQQSRRRREAEGIALDAATWAELLAAGSALGLEEAALRELAQVG